MFLNLCYCFFEAADKPMGMYRRIRKLIKDIPKFWDKEEVKFDFFSYLEFLRTSAATSGWGYAVS